MSTSISKLNIKNFYLSMFYSLLVHGMLVLIFYFFTQRIFQNNHETQELIELKRMLNRSVRVDVVGLPSKTLQELKNIKLNNSMEEKKEQGENAQSSKDETPVQAKSEDIKERPLDQSAKESNDIAQKAKSEKINFNNMLSEFSKKDVLKEEKGKLKNNGSKTTKNKISSKNLQDIKKLVLEGNKVNHSGTAVTGDNQETGELTKFEQYLMQIPDQIRPNWKLPTFLLEKNLKCRVKIFINSTGQIINSVILESSGVPDFDLRALESIKKTKILIPPDKEFVTSLIHKGVVLGFPL